MKIFLKIDIKDRCKLLFIYFLLVVLVSPLVYVIFLPLFCLFKCYTLLFFSWIYWSTREYLINLLFTLSTTINLIQTPNFRYEYVFLASNFDTPWVIDHIENKMSKKKRWVILKALYTYEQVYNCSSHCPYCLCVKESN